VKSQWWSEWATLLAGDAVFSRDGSRAAALLQAAYIRDAIGFTVPVCGREWTMASWSDCRQCSEIRVDEGPDPGRERCRS
jgi:hypothetical protein